MRNLNLDKTKNILVIINDSWHHSQGFLVRFERKNGGEVWSQVSEPIPVVIGRNGFAWGRGLHDLPEDAEFIKQEGDGRSPAGLFTIGTAFGFIPADEVDFIKLPYKPITEMTVCVDDSSSTHYNTILEKDGVNTNDWNSCENMLAVGEEYRWGVVIEHNQDPITPGAGSCIFFHIWAGPDIGTSGCTAMSAEDMVELLKWLDPAANPVVVQLPMNEYKKYAELWELPSIE